MSAPLVHDPKPLQDRLVRLLDERRTVTSELAYALRCALSTCDEYQQLALIGEQLAAEGPRSDVSRWLDLGRLEMCNRVVRAITDGLDGLQAALDRIPAGVDPLVLDLLDDLANVEDCEIEADGHCESHGWWGKASCPQARVKRVLAEAGMAR